MLLILILLLELFVTGAEARDLLSGDGSPVKVQVPNSSSFSVNAIPQFIPCSPESEPLVPLSSNEPSLQFCQQWNPDFSANGQKCCAKPSAPRRGKRRRSAGRCSPRRANMYCSEATPEQREYAAQAASGKLGDILSLLTREIGRRGDQAYCTVNNGFLVRGRPILETSSNRIVIHSPDRCLNYGTDAMAAMIEWLGREIGRTFSADIYSGVRLSIGDVSGPRGGCLIGRSGRRGHASHTNGQDADIGFLSVKKGKVSPVQFVREFEVANNWWLLKRFFKNPFACIRVIFLDKRHIRSLAKVAKNDEDWKLYGRFIRHMPGHKNHFHVRIGNGPGLPGCTPNAHPELELEEDFDLFEDPDDSEILDQLKASQSSNIEE